MRVIGEVSIHHVSVAQVPGQYGLVPLTSVTFEHNGEFYGSRYHGALSPGDIAGLRESFRQRRAREVRT